MQAIALLTGALENAAKGAWKCGRPNAVDDIADLVEGFGGAGNMKTASAKRESGNGFAGPSPAMARDVLA